MKVGPNIYDYAKKMVKLNIDLDPKENLATLVSRDGSNRASGCISSPKEQGQHDLFDSMSPNSKNKCEGFLVAT